MKKGIKNICKLLILGIAIASTSVIAKEKVFSRKVNEVRNDFSFLLNNYFDGYLKYKDKNCSSDNVIEKTVSNKKRIVETRGGKKRSLYDEVKNESLDIIVADSFISEYFEAIVDENIPDKKQEEIDEIAATESGFQLAHDILIQENYEVSLISYIDDLEFRDECLKTEFALVDGKPTEKQMKANESSKQQIEAVFEIMEKDGTTVSIASHGDDFDNSNDEVTDGEESITPSNSRMVIPFEPEETRTVEQLAILFPAWVVSAIVLGCSTLGLAAGTISIPIYGQIAAAVFVCLTVAILLTIASYIISFISYVIGFFVNMLENLISLIGTLFNKLTKQAESDPLGTAIDEGEEELKEHGFSKEEAEKILETAFWMGSGAITIELLKKIRPLVILGTKEDQWFEKAQASDDYVYFNPNSVFLNSLFLQERYSTIWLFNKLFLNVCIYRNALFYLISVPSKYYNKETLQIILDKKFYAHELYHINSKGYDWYEPEGYVNGNFVGVFSERY